MLPPSRPRFQQLGSGGANDRMKMLRRRMDGDMSAAGAAPGRMQTNAVRTGPGAPTQPRPARPNPTAPTHFNVPQSGQAGVAQPAGASADPTDAKVEDFVKGLIGAQADTADEEALIRELMLDQQQNQMMGARSRMGRAGMAESGASVALESDIMRKANQSASGQIIDNRQAEEQQAIDDSFRAIDADRGLTQDARDEAFRQKILEILGQDVDPAEAAAASEASPESDPAFLGAIGQGGAEVNNTELHATNGGVVDLEDGSQIGPDGSVTYQGFVVENEQRPNSQRMADDPAYPGFEVWRDVDGGTVYLIRKA